jgi:hypothetical protein
MTSWFKFYGQDWLTDIKIIQLRPEDRLCYITLLCLASVASERGIIKDYNEEIIIQLTQLSDYVYDDDNEYTRAKGFTKRLIEKEMVALDEKTKTLTINNFLRRQETSLTGYERVKRYRGKHKEVINDNADDNDSDNDRVDKIRIDKNRKDNIYSSINFLKNIPPNDLKELTERYSVSASFVKGRADDVIDYCEAKGKIYKNYKAALRNFIKSHLEKHPESIVAKAEPPKEPDKRTPEEQARVRAKLAEMRKGMNKIIKKF